MENFITSQSDCSDSPSDPEDDLLSLSDPLMVPNSSPSHEVVANTLEFPSAPKCQLEKQAEECSPEQISKPVELADSVAPLQEIASKVDIELNKPLDRVPTPVNQVYEGGTLRPHRNKEAKWGYQWREGLFSLRAVLELGYKQFLFEDHFMGCEWIREA